LFGLPRTSTRGSCGTAASRNTIARGGEPGPVAFHCSTRRRSAVSRSRMARSKKRSTWSGGTFPGEVGP
jgi:hypothetical protein